MTTMTEDRRPPLPEAGRSRRMMLLLFAVFLGPLLIAVAMYAGRDRLPLQLGQVNYGRLLAMPISDPRLATLMPGRWRYLLLSEGRCDLLCEADLFKLRQLDIALGKDSDRVGYAVVRATPPGPEWAELQRRHPQMQLVVDPGLARALADLPGVSAGHTLLLDPLGNAVLDYAPGFNVRPVKKDIHRLLKVSHIG